MPPEVPPEAPYPYAGMGYANPHAVTQIEMIGTMARAPEHCASGIDRSGAHA